MKESEIIALIKENDNKMDTEKFIDEKIKSGFLNERYNVDGTTSVIGERSYLCEVIDDLFKQRLEASPIETLVIPQNESEKQVWFIVTVMRSMNKDEVEMLCKNLLARYDINLGILVQHVNQIKDEKLTV